MIRGDLTEFTAQHEADLMETLDQVQKMLMEAAEWCHKREIFLRMEQGSYQPAPSPVRLMDGLQTMLGANAKVEAPETAIIDHTVFQLVMQEALSNCTKYSNPEAPIEAKARLCAEIEGTPEALHLSVKSRNRRGLPHLSKADCVKVFSDGFKKPSSASHSRLSACSDGLGLASIRLAMRAVGGDVWMAADEAHTTIHFLFPVVSITEDESQSTKSSSRKELPENHHEKSRESEAECDEGYSHANMGSSDSTLVDSEGSTSEEEALALLSDFCKPPTTAGIDSAPVCIGIDDSKMHRKVQSMIFKVFMHADKKRSGSLGETVTEMEAFVDVVMGKRTLTLEPASLPPADIAVLDQNIDYEDRGVSIKGSELALKLREAGFKGVVCILTGACSGQLRELASLPGVDFAYEKNAGPSTIATELIAAHKARTSEYCTMATI